MNRTAAEALEEARDRLMSLEADPSDLKMGLRPAFRGGFSQHKRLAQRLLNKMIAELGHDG